MHPFPFWLLIVEIPWERTSSWRRRKWVNEGGGQVERKPIWWWGSPCVVVSVRSIWIVENEMDWGVNSKGTTYRHFIVIVSCSFSIPSRDYHSKMLCPLSPIKHQGLVRPRYYRKGNWQWARYKEQETMENGKRKGGEFNGWDWD